MTFTRRPGFCQAPARQALATPVVSGKLNGKPRKHPHGEEGEALGLDRVAAPADLFGEPGVDAGAALNGLDDRRIPPPAAADDEPGRPLRQEIERLADGGGREGGERRGAVLEAKALSPCRR